MDNLTHSLFGLTLAQTPLRRVGPGATLTLVLASNAPDSDIVVAMTRGGAAYLTAHRGSSHGPLGVVGLALLTAGLVYAGFRWWKTTAPDRAASGASFLSLVGLALVATLAHVLMDLPTPYGTRSLSPFDRMWYTVDWMPIIDVYLLGVLAAGLLAVYWSPAARTRITLIVLLLVASNYGLRAELHAAALRRSMTNRNPPAALSAWPDLPYPKLPGDYMCPAHPCALTTAALPTFGSPFRWRIVRQFSNGYRFSEINLLAGREQSLGWMRADDGAAVEIARGAANSQTFLAFSRFPAAQVDHAGQQTIVRMSDVRFLDVPVSGRVAELRPTRFFTVTVRLDRQGKVLEHRFGDVAGGEPRSK